MSRPDVSVIIPVCNSVDYIEDAIGSVVDQSISRERVEIIMTDDGSTDGSGAVMARWAAEDSRITVLTQENSGTPGGGRNPGIDRAAGTFVFFLDSDDVMAPGALERMVDVAIAEESDVVLGKIGSLDGRKVPTGMFESTILDAHLVRDKVFRTLGPTKLIRRDMIERLHLRFPEDQTVGEDEPFMAAAYLNARKISVLADMDYYLVRYRSDRDNMTLAARDSASHAEVAMRVTEVIGKYTDAGAFRDALLKRPLDRPLARALDSRWLKMAPEDRSRLAGEICSRVGPLYSGGARRLLRSETRVKVDLLMAGNLDGLDSYISYLATRPTLMSEWWGGEFRQKVPSEVARLVPRELRRVPAPSMTCRLEGLSVRSETVGVSASVAVAHFVGSPSDLLVRARKRNTELVEEATTTYIDRAPGSGSFLIEAEFERLSRGIWDVHVVIRFDEWEKELRLGAERTRSIEPEGASNIAETHTPKDRVVAYFTKGYGNLSIDSGSVLHQRASVARAVGLTLDENGRAVLLVQTAREPQPQDEYFAHLTGIRQHGGRQHLPGIRLGERMVGLRLPLRSDMTGATLAVTSVLGGVTAALPMTGTEFWPARAAGFGLAPTDDGGVELVPASSTGKSVRQARRRSRFARIRYRVGADPRAQFLKGVPVIGPVLRIASRLTRERRS